MEALAKLLLRAPDGVELVPNLFQHSDGAERVRAIAQDLYDVAQRRKLLLGPPAYTPPAPSGGGRHNQVPQPFRSQPQPQPLPMPVMCLSPILGQDMGQNTGRSEQPKLPQPATPCLPQLRPPQSRAVGELATWPHEPPLKVARQVRDTGVDGSTPAGSAPPCTTQHPMDVPWYLTALDCPLLLSAPPGLSPPRYFRAPEPDTWPNMPEALEGGTTLVSAEGGFQHSQPYNLATSDSHGGNKERVVAHSPSPHVTSHRPNQEGAGPLAAPPKQLQQGPCAHLTAPTLRLGTKPPNPGKGGDRRGRWQRRTHWPPAPDCAQLPASAPQHFWHAGDTAGGSDGLRVRLTKKHPTHLASHGIRH